MTISRHEKIFLLKQKILEVTEQLLLENNQDIVVGELAEELDIAKGTIYKYFKCKNQLYLELLILNETRLLEIAQKFKTDVQEGIRQFMLYHLMNSNRTVLLHSIEERITSQERGIKNKFEELYEVREKRIVEVKDITVEYLISRNCAISLRDYLSYVWTITHGACLLLSSTYYQKSIGERQNLINFYIKQAINV
ncbi:TetR/AcrR family transcriptional regulator [Acinetobacter cumulans]|jgi:AcrR family transcriptional regulator|uniref:TetR family transcriptional regulator n=1 Tax=Acinetobacter cumulans TaxID=2136182 RepID=A0A3A8FP41_9GAMM|nr:MULTISPECIES: TetR/AcrR family transcriptional regulator [Acinetobacter]RKG46375.1 TetR/AcrR family transcriptional regulator [Acinetobacter cumulans]RKG48502.1 TetR/AcrR family transcriptional regulator [Acinetobacter cumulans]RLL39822.1 TetR family transcriptional regulator [Acinetobacter cumulans]RZG61602.1 TetR/AcrR family transcriptional regulator [Acinetobacter sp. WCHAc060006]